MVSAGAGEDISFDVALAGEFGATVHIIDPTPRAVHHVKAVLSRLGCRRTDEFVPGGAQSASAYDLAKVGPNQLVLHEYALWHRDDLVNFFPPENPDHVSHTVENWRQVLGEQEVLQVVGRRLRSLLPQEDLDRIALLKLDIEGAEIEVISDLLSAAILPEQVLVEFDQLAIPNRVSRRRAKHSFALLRHCGYRLAMREKLNFTFIRPG